MYSISPVIPPKLHNWLSHSVFTCQTLPNARITRGVWRHFAEKRRNRQSRLLREVGELVRGVTLSHTGLHILDLPSSYKLHLIHMKKWEGIYISLPPLEFMKIKQGKLRINGVNVDVCRDKWHISDVCNHVHSCERLFSNLTYMYTNKCNSKAMN